MIGTFGGTLATTSEPFIWDGQSSMTAAIEYRRPGAVVCVTTDSAGESSEIVAPTGRNSSFQRYRNVTLEPFGRAPITVECSGPGVRIFDGWLGFVVRLGGALFAVFMVIGVLVAAVTFMVRRWLLTRWMRTQPEYGELMRSRR
ncbi:hypothetical protein [Stackebrandtia soli]|uniref:hypothetical protein n=1 Tax=Stackebrandtia soli TaxID=1892856 RepID=UPI0039E82762